MATLTSIPNDTTLTFSRFSSSASGNISWTIPSIPEGAIINSCTLTGIATASNSNVTSIKVNNQTVSVSTSGASFSINLGTDTSISSVATSATKSGYSAYNVKFTNMTYTIDYSIYYTVNFKDYNGNVLKTDTVLSGSRATAPSNPTRDGYTFTGWQPAITTVINADTDFVAQYEKNLTVTITQNKGGYFTYNNQNYEGNNTFTVSPGSSMDIDIYANNNYSIYTMTINGSSEQLNTSSYSTSIGNIQTDYTVAIVYKNSSGEIETTSNIFVGDSNIKTIYIGSTVVQSVYIGDNKIF